MKINIKLSVVIVAMLSAAVVSAQKPRKLTDTQRRQFEKEFIAKSREIASLQCGFTQTKTSVLVAGSAVSKGNMYYSSPSMLAWEYVAPIKSVLVVNGKYSRQQDVFERNIRYIVGNRTDRAISRRQATQKLLSADKYQDRYQANGRYRNRNARK